MKNFFKFSLTAAALFLVFGAFSVSETQAQAQIVNQLLNKMDNHYNALDVLKSNLTMSKYNPQIKRSEVSKGNITYLPKTAKREMYVRLDWTSPSEEYLTVVKGNYTLYKPGINTYYTGKVSSAENKAKVNGPLTFLSMSKKQLKDNYTVQIIATSEKVNGTTDATHLKLTPKTKSNYQQVDLWVDGDGMPIQATVLEKSGDSTTILLYDVQKNIDYDPKVFALRVPKGAKEIKG